MQEPPTAAGLAALLDWYRAMGVEDITAEAPVDWLARGDIDREPGRTEPRAGPMRPAMPSPEARTPALPPAPGQVQTPPPARARTAPVVPKPPPRPAAGGIGPGPGGAAASGSDLAAREAARNAPTLEALGNILSRFDGCGLRATAKNLCFYRGAPKARLMVIGEAPGREEDLEGRPFVGPAGKLLDKMLAAIGLDEADVHITNTVYWRPPGNRHPTTQELEVCRPFLERQMELVAPQIVLALGGAAAKQVIGSQESITRLRGQWFDISVAGHTMRAIATLHPAYLLRTPAHKRQAWLDMLAVSRALAS